MKKFNFLICYDISDVKRLVKVAKTVEKNAIRIQKSIFLLIDTSKEEMYEIVEAIENIINMKEDDVRIYKIDIHQSLHFNSAVDLKNPIVV
jgi:CRISPR-associated protein Cas2